VHRSLIRIERDRQKCADAAQTLAPADRIAARFRADEHEFNVAIIL
jgi:hypothetical protein